MSNLIEKSTLKTLEILKNFNEEDYDDIIPYLKSHHYEKNDVIIKQNSSEVDFHLIMSGVALVEVQLFGDSRTNIIELKTGEHFGGISLIADKPSTATITALSPMNCIVLSSESLKLISTINSRLAFQIRSIIAQDCCHKIRENIQKLPEQKDLFKKFPIIIQDNDDASKEIDTRFRNIKIEKIYEIHHKVPFFNLLTAEEFSYLTKLSQVRYYNKDEYLFKEDENNHYCTFILWGTVQTSISSKNLPKIGVFGPGTIVGAIDFLDNEKKVFTARARECCISLVLSQKDIKEIHDVQPILWYKIYNAFFVNVAKDLIRINTLFTHINIIENMETLNMRKES